MLLYPYHNSTMQVHESFVTKPIKPLYRNLYEIITYTGIKTGWQTFVRCILSQIRINWTDLKLEKKNHFLCDILESFENSKGMYQNADFVF